MTFSTLSIRPSRACLCVPANAVLFSDSERRRSFPQRRAPQQTLAAWTTGDRLVPWQLESGHSATKSTGLGTLRAPNPFAALRTLSPRGIRCKPIAVCTWFRRCKTVKNAEKNHGFAQSGDRGVRYLVKQPRFQAFFPGQRAARPSKNQLRVQHCKLPGRSRRKCDRNRCRPHTPWLQFC
jgi:hypothetical protein